MTTRFVPWIPLHEAGQQAPRRPGIYQVRLAAGLIDYPRGKSAMVHYGHADDLRARALELLTERGGDWLFRHADDAETPESERALVIERLSSQFLRRFGAEPSFPEDIA